MAGLSIPLTVFNIIFDKAIKAPVFPADNTASDSPLETDSILDHIEDSFPIFLNASIGFTSIGTTSLV